MNDTELIKIIHKIANELSDAKGYVCSVDVLLKLGYLSQADYENWRFGRTDSLERVCQCNLSKLKTINQAIRQVSMKMNFKPSLSVYNKWGKGVKQRLRFCKSGNTNIEKAYSTHYVNIYQINKLKENNNNVSHL